MLTRSSVHWAERMVATSSSQGVVKSSEQRASGYATRSRRRIARTRLSGGDVSLTRLTVLRPAVPARRRAQAIERWAVGAVSPERALNADVAQPADRRPQSPREGLGIARGEARGRDLDRRRSRKQNAISACAAPAA